MRPKSRADTWVRPYRKIAVCLRLYMKIARWGGPPCRGRRPSLQPYGGQGRPPHQHQPFFIFRCVCEEMIVGIRANNESAKVFLKIKPGGLFQNAGGGSRLRGIPGGNRETSPGRPAEASGLPEIGLEVPGGGAQGDQGPAAPPGAPARGAGSRASPGPPGAGARRWRAG